MRIYDRDADGKPPVWITVILTNAVTITTLVWDYTIKINHYTQETTRFTWETHPLTPSHMGHFAIHELYLLVRADLDADELEALRAATDLSASHRDEQIQHLNAPPLERFGIRRADLTP